MEKLKSGKKSSLWPLVDKGSVATLSSQARPCSSASKSQSKLVKRKPTNMCKEDTSLNQNSVPHSCLSVSPARGSVQPVPPLLSFNRRTKLHIVATAEYIASRTDFMTIEAYT